MFYDLIHIYCTVHTYQFWRFHIDASVGVYDGKRFDSKIMSSFDWTWLEMLTRQELYPNYLIIKASGDVRKVARLFFWKKCAITKNVYTELAEFSNLLLKTWTGPTKSNLLPNDIAYRFRLSSRLQINCTSKIDLLHHVASTPTTFGL